MKDALRWKLSLRNKEKLNVEKLGIKSLILSRNKFGDYFAEKLSIALASDEYIKSICLKKNNIGKDGIRNLAQSVDGHSGLICVDLRHNPGYKLSSTSKFKSIMIEKFFDNIECDIERCKIFGNSRIKIDWIYPEALGLKGNRLDIFNKNEVNPQAKRKYFVELCSAIAARLDRKFAEVLKTFFGHRQAQLTTLKRQLNSIRASSVRSSRANSSRGPRSRSLSKEGTAAMGAESHNPDPLNIMSKIEKGAASSKKSKTNRDAQQNNDLKTPQTGSFISQTKEIIEQKPAAASLVVSATQPRSAAPRRKTPEAVAAKRAIISP